MPGTMNAVVMHAPGGPEVLKLETRPVPKPDATEVLIKVHADTVQYWDGEENGIIRL